MQHLFALYSLTKKGKSRDRFVYGFFLSSSAPTIAIAMTMMTIPAIVTSMRLELLAEVATVEVEVGDGEVEVEAAAPIDTAIVAYELQYDWLPANVAQIVYNPAVVGVHVVA